MLLPTVLACMLSHTHAPSRHTPMCVNVYCMCTRARTMQRFACARRARRYYLAARACVSLNTQTPHIRDAVPCEWNFFHPILDALETSVAMQE